MDKVKTLEELESKLSEFPDLKALSHQERFALEQFHVGSINLKKYEKDSENYKKFAWFFEKMPPLRLIKWGDLEQLRRDKKLMAFNGLQFQCNTYHKFLPYVYTSGQPDPDGAPGAVVPTKFKTANLNDELVTMRDVVKDEIKEGDFKYDNFETSLQSMYYHSAKAHWLTQSIREEGLWNPIQGYVVKIGDDNYQLRIHPGSVRSGVFEEMEDPNMELLIWDVFDMIPHAKSMTLDDTLEYWLGLINKKDGAHDNLSVIWTNGTLEFQSDMSSIDFRKYVYRHNEKVTRLAKKKPLNIYIGYDSTHNGIEKVSKKSLETSIHRSIGGGHLVNYSEFEPEIKFLDVSKIPEYTRPYENQSTWFTYSRFLIPYLENYEGFSLFIDDDFIFQKNPLTMFYYLNMDDAVACIKYPQIKHDEKKFNGEVNIDYPCKLWSSMMFFNNGHPDCKKLTPEVVNTWTGQQLHQFEWTDKISAIPEKYIFTEGYDDPEVKWDFAGVHYTRGGPWIDGMDYSHINNLEIYNRFKNQL